MRANGWANKSGHMGAAYNILREANEPFSIFVLGAAYGGLFDLHQRFPFPHGHIIQSAYVALRK
jgi:hypothetical protein